MTRPVGILQSTKQVYLPRANSVPTAWSLSRTTANTKTAWSQLTASTTGDIDTLMLFASTYLASTLNGTLIDIGIGGSGSEVVIVPNMQVGNRATKDDGMYTGPIECPVWIPSGTRIAARFQTSSASGGSANFYLEGYGGRRRFGELAGVIESLNASTATSLGTSVTAAGSQHTKGSWTQIIASTANQYKALIVSCACPTNGVGVTSAWSLLDIGIGAAASESVIVADQQIKIWQNAAITHWSDEYCRIAAPIPAGTRIAARLGSEVASTVVSVCVYGVR